MGFRDGTVVLYFIRQLLYPLSTLPSLQLNFFLYIHPVDLVQLPFPDMVLCLLCQKLGNHRQVVCFWTVHGYGMLRDNALVHCEDLSLILV